MVKSIDSSTAGDFFAKYETKPMICSDILQKMRGSSAPQPPLGGALAPSAPPWLRPWLCPHFTLAAIGEVYFLERLHEKYPIPLIIKILSHT